MYANNIGEMENVIYTFLFASFKPFIFLQCRIPSSLSYTLFFRPNFSWSESIGGGVGEPGLFASVCLSVYRSVAKFMIIYPARNRGFNVESLWRLWTMGRKRGLGLLLVSIAFK